MEDKPLVSSASRTQVSDRPPDFHVTERQAVDPEKVLKQAIDMNVLFPCFAPLLKQLQEAHTFTLVEWKVPTGQPEPQYI